VLSLSIEIDNTAVVNELAYDWVFGFHHRPTRVIALRGGSSTDTETGKSMHDSGCEVLAVDASRILRIQPPAVVDFSADSKVQTW